MLHRQRHHSLPSFAGVLLAAGMLLVVTQRAEAQRDEFERSPINYHTADVSDPVAQLARQVEAGKQSLTYDDKVGYLKSVLEALQVPISSQMLVFSKTSLQQSRISPHRPRAIYFNDDVYVGYCQNGDVIELAATDPKQGAIFYTLEQTPGAEPKFVRDRGQCLACHASNRTQSVPGYLVRSVFANRTGLPEFGSGTFTTDHTSPLEERWGGWYVTGTHGDMRHMGNALFDKEVGTLDKETHANLTSLRKFLSTKAYLSPHSDIIALMVMEHQTQMHNAIAWANYETRMAIHQSQIMNEALKRPMDHLTDSSVRRIDRAADRVLEYLLLCDEFPLTSPLEGTSDFAKEFQAAGIRDAEGRSLRDLDMQTRMFRYPCSYLIYSDAFGALPDQVRHLVLERLATILTGEDDSPEYAHLTATDRQNIIAILTATKPEFAAIQ